MSEWLLCPAAHAEAARTNVVIRCDMNRHHVCNGPRTPYLWDAFAPGADGARVEWKSERPHCGSCLSDQEYGDYAYDEECCCSHRIELESRGEQDK